MDECDAVELLEAQAAASLDWSQLRCDPTPVPLDFAALQQRLQDGCDVDEGVPVADVD